MSSIISWIEICLTKLHLTIRSDYRISLIEKLMKFRKWHGSQYECYPKSQTNLGMVYFYWWRTGSPKCLKVIVRFYYIQGIAERNLAFSLPAMFLSPKRCFFSRVAKTTRSLFMVLNCQATKDGYDVQMQTNHLSHFLLTKESLNCRICGAGLVNFFLPKGRDKQWIDDKVELKLLGSSPHRFQWQPWRSASNLHRFQVDSSSYAAMTQLKVKKRCEIHFLFGEDSPFDCNVSSTS